MPEIDVMKCFPVIIFINWTMAIKSCVEKDWHATFWLRFIFVELQRHNLAQKWNTYLTTNDRRQTCYLQSYSEIGKLLNQSDECRYQLASTRYIYTLNFTAYVVNSINKNYIRNLKLFCIRNIAAVVHVFLLYNTCIPALNERKINFFFNHVKEKYNDSFLGWCSWDLTSISYDFHNIYRHLIHEKCDL